MAHFEGTIIITDPAFVLGNEFPSRKNFKTFMIESNVWGDGVWNLVDKKTKEPLAKYETVSGKTAVFLEEDILAYNPQWFKFNDSSTYARFENFVGEVYTKFDEEKAMRVWDSKGTANFISK